VFMTAVSLIDVLADLRPDVDDDVLLVRFFDGGTHAVTIRAIVRGEGVGLRIDRQADGSLRATLQSDGGWEPSRVVESLWTVPFAEFVGASARGSR
jgi:hypothetical protein